MRPRFPRAPACHRQSSPSPPLMVARMGHDTTPSSRRAHTLVRLPAWNTWHLRILSLTLAGRLCSAFINAERQAATHLLSIKFSALSSPEQVRAPRGEAVHAQGGSPLSSRVQTTLKRQAPVMERSRP